MDVVDHGPVRVLRFDRPEKLNALDHGLTSRARDAMRAAVADDGVRVVVITGSGRAFCAGVDLDWLAEMAAGTTDGTSSQEFADEVRDCPKPVIAAVNGLAVGMGTTMCLHVDLVVAALSARFRTPFTQLGVAPEIGSSWLLPQQIGYQRAAWMLMSSEWVDAPAALDLGLVYEVVPDEALLDRAVGLGRVIAERNPASVAAVKRTMRAWRAPAIEAAVAAENEEFRRLMADPDFSPRDAV